MKSYNTLPDMSYKSEELWFPLSEDIFTWDKDFHTLMLNDQLRMQAYERAIKAVVKPGMVICDLGTGTGILALWVLEAGAARVYGIDVKEERLSDAKRRIQAAGYSERFVTCLGLSYDVQLPEKVDVIISEILGNLGDNEDMTPILADARFRFLKKKGVMLPAGVTSYLAPITSPVLHDQVKNRRCRILNERYSLKHLMDSLGTRSPFDLYYDAIVPQDAYLSQPRQLQDFNFQGDDKAEYSVDLHYPIEQAGIFTGFKGYFTADLGGGISLDISSDKISARETSDCWKHCFLPIEIPFEVEVGDSIHLTFQRYYPDNRESPFRQGYSWRGKIYRNNQLVHSFEQHTV